MIAGLLNMLVIFDAYSGPIFADPGGAANDPEDDEAGTQNKGDSSGTKN